jgi:cyclophilin family peptidyl-prolyl cis-trans isomerase
MYVLVNQVGSVGMFHSKGDRNGASVSIFFPQVDRKVPVSKLNELPVMQRLNNKYCLFAYAIDGEDIIDRLRPGDIIDSVTVEPGTWKLYQPDPDGRYEVIPAETTSS